MEIQTLVSRVTGGNTSDYTTTDVTTSQMLQITNHTHRLSAFTIFLFPYNLDCALTTYHFYFSQNITLPRTTLIAKTSD